jgi:hypothetical protein
MMLLNLIILRRKSLLATDNIPKTVEAKEVHQVEIKAAINATSIGAHSKSQVPPFLVTYEIFNFNVHNCLADSGASSNIMPYAVCQKINVVPQLTKTRIIQLDRTYVKVKGELKYVLIRLASDPRVHQVIDIVVVDIPESYGLLLSRDWSAKLQGYFSTDWSHLWLPYKGKPNQIHVNTESHMKHTVTELEGKNKPIIFAHTVLGNYFLETDHGCYEAQPSETQTDTQSELLPCDRLMIMHV